MSKRSKKLPKKRQNSDYWIYGHHAVVGALMNENRVKYEVYFTSEAEKKLKSEIKLENLNVISIKKLEMKLTYFKRYLKSSGHLFKS